MEILRVMASCWIRLRVHEQREFCCIRVKFWSYHRYICIVQSKRITQRLMTVKFVMSAIDWYILQYFYGELAFHFYWNSIHTSQDCSIIHYDIVHVTSRFSVAEDEKLNLTSIPNKRPHRWSSSLTSYTLVSR